MTKIDFPPEMDVYESGGKDAGIGGILRAFRKRRGASLEDVSRVLCIRQVYLLAIEDGRFEELPGSIYSFGFVRAYAQYLGLDDDQIVERFKSENSNLGNKPSLSFPAMVPDHGIPGGAILMLGLIIAVLGYGGWYFVSSQGGFESNTVSELPRQLASKLDENMAASAGALGGGPAQSEPSSAVAAPNPASGPPPEIVQTSTLATAKPPAGEAEANQTQDPVIDKAASKTDTPRAEPLQSASTPQSASEPQSASAPQSPSGTQSPSETQSASVPESITTSPDAATSPAAGAVTREVAAPAGGAESSTAVDPAPDQTSARESARESEKIPQQPAAPPQSQSPSQSQSPPQSQFADSGTESEGEQLASRAPAAIDDGEPTGEDTDELNHGPVPAIAEPEIIVKAKLDSWVQIRDDNANQLIMTRLMRGGDSYRVPRKSGLTLLTGNAGALEITVDGEVMPPIGPPGSVRRHVTLKADLLRKGTAVIE